MKYLYRLYQLVICLPILLVASVLTSLATVLGCMLGNGKLDGFMRVYQEFYLADFKERFFKSDSGTEKLALLQDETAAKGIPLYLIIDEYDNFTNTVLNEQGEKVYWAITHTDGFYRDVFKKFKEIGRAHV